MIFIVLKGVHHAASLLNSVTENHVFLAVQLPDQSEATDPSKFFYGSLLVSGGSQSSDIERLGADMNDVIRECLESKPELLKRYERNEARYVLQLPENYVTISINLGFGKAKLESLILALAELDLTIDEWFCFKLKDWILADRLSKEDDSGE